MNLDDLDKLAAAATPAEDWLNDLFADHWKPRTEEYYAEHRDRFSRAAQDEYAAECAAAVEDAA